MNKTWIVLSLGAFSIASAAIAADMHSSGARFKATLDSYQEVPTRSTTGMGDFMVSLSSDGSSLSYRLRYQDLEGVPTMAHIHLGARGVNGGVIAHLCGGGDKPACPASGEVTGTIDAQDIVGPAAQGIAAGELDEVLLAMKMGVVYANVHTDLFPEGEIRGQVMKSHK